jgi:hypothetical protein
MIAVADPQEPAEAHDGVFRLAGSFVDHYVVNAAELLAGPVVDGRSINLAGRNKTATGVRWIFDARHHHLLHLPPIGALAN